MKRKLNAIIALAMVVVMVFPTAIFVGAADPAITAKVGGKDFASGGTISVPVDTPAAMTLTIPEGYTASVKKTTENGASLVTGTGNTLTFTGNREGKTDTYTITGVKEGAANLTFTVNVACVPVELKTETLKLLTVNGTTVDGRFDCAAGTEISAATLRGTLTNGKAASFKNIRFSLTGTDYAEKVKVTAKDNGGTLYIRYEVEGVSGTHTPQQVTLIVTGMAVEAVTAVANSSISHSSDTISKSDFTADYVNVKANLNGTVVGIESDVTFKFMNGTEEWTGSTINNENISSLTFTVTYGGVESGSYAVSAFVSLAQEKPASIEVNLSGLTKKEYVAGEKVTEVTNSKIKDFVTVKDAEGNPIPADKLFFKSITFGEFIFGSGTVKVTVVVNGSTFNEDVSLAGSGITVSERSVTGIALSNKSTMKTEYKEGDILDLDGLMIEVKYNFGDPEHIQYSNFDFTCNPQAGAVLNATDKTLLVVYKDPDTKQEFTCEVPLTVAPADTTKKIKEVKLLSSTGAKREYFIGEPFDTAGLEILIVFTDASTAVVEMSGKETGVTVDSSRYDNTNKKFTSALNADLKISFKVTYKVDGKDYSENISVTVPDISVVKRPALSSIVASSDETDYMEGESPRVCDFTITAKYDDGSTRVFDVDDTVTGATKTTYTITENSVTYTVRLSPTMIESDTDAIRVNYTEKVTGSTSVTKYDDFEIEVTVPEAILSYYDSGWVTKPYTDFYDALDAAMDYAATLSTTYSRSRMPSIELRQDITMLSSYSVDEYMEIDLNGFDLTMIRGDIFVRSNSSAIINFVNSGENDSRLIYSSSDEEENIIIAEDETYSMDAGSADGKYEVTINKPTNGKVTGPDEVTHGHDAKFTITPDEDYETNVITVKQGSSTKKYTVKDNVVTVEDVQGELTITVTFKEKAWDNPFTDVYKSATYYEAVKFVYEEGLFSGMSATKFEPDTNMTRAMFVTVLGRLAGIDADDAASRYGYSSDFTDVSSTDQSISYAIPYIKWASQNGLIEGYGNGKFGPKDNITHAQMYVLMQRYASLIERKNVNASGTNIAANDVKDIPDWAYEAVEYASKNSFLVTSSYKLTPNANAKRSELAMLLNKFCTNVLDD